MDVIVKLGPLLGADMCRYRGLRWMPGVSVKRGKLEQTRAMN